MTAEFNVHALAPFVWVENPQASTAPPMIIGVPHAGRLYPADFGFQCDPLLLRQSEDAYVDLLVAPALPAVQGIYSAPFPRSYIDVNRAEDDIDPQLLAEPWPVPLNPSPNTLRGLGLVRRLMRQATPVYSAPLMPDVIRQRIVNYHRPYHEGLWGHLTRLRDRYGYAVLFDCHSMPNRPVYQGQAWPDCVVGDLDGTAAAISMVEATRAILTSLGLSVAYNNPFKGVEIAQRYGKPAQKTHVLQIEINRSLYMDEDRVALHDGAGRVTFVMQQFFQHMAMWLVEHKSKL